MRKAAWGAIVLGVWALSFGSPIREIAPLHRVLGIGLLVGYLLLSLDPPVQSKQQHDLFIAGIVCSIAAFLLAFLDLPYVANVLARLLAVAVVALPLWLAAGSARTGFIIAGALALSTGIPFVDASGPYATSVHAYVAAASAVWVGLLLHNPTPFTMGDKKPPRLVVASNIVTLTQDEKAQALARLERRFRDGELAEHDYLDKRQELESR